VAFIVLAAAAVLLLSRIAASGRFHYLALIALAFGMAAILVTGVANWRTGLLLFFVWLLLEDLPRKYLGNNMAVYFSKDVLAVMAYTGFAVALRKGDVPLPRLPFALPLAAFMALGVVQAFNPSSPSPLYGLVGLKVYFFYVPLVLLGYALVRSQVELARALVGLSIAVLLIGSLGIAQGIVGLDFLNPEQLAPELQSLGRETRISPLTGRTFPRATSVFVSEARQGSFMLLSFVIGSGAALFMTLRGERWRSIALTAAAVALSALVFHGSRAGVLYAAVSVVVLSAAFVWLAGYGAAARRQVALAVAGVACVTLAVGAALLAFFPSSVAARWALYVETISPWSPASELGWRLWGYPTMYLRGVVESGYALLGRGIGTASLGTEYVRVTFGVPSPGFPAESGLATLLLELGLLGPILWVAWSGALVASAWGVVRRLRGTNLFPVGAAILWFAFLLLFPFTYGALNAYQNYLYNAFFWLLLGVLYRLPSLAEPAPGGSPGG
jgi:hypothetical protein